MWLRVVAGCAWPAPAAMLNLPAAASWCGRPTLKPVLVQPQDLQAGEGAWRAPAGRQRAVQRGAAERPAEHGWCSPGSYLISMGCISSAPCTRWEPLLHRGPGPGAARQASQCLQRGERALLAPRLGQPSIQLAAVIQVPAWGGRAA